MKKTELKQLIKEEISNTLKPNDPRFTHQPADKSMLSNVRYALGNINQRALHRDIAHLVLQNKIFINDEGDIVIKFFSKPRK